MIFLTGGWKIKNCLLYEEGDIDNIMDGTFIYLYYMKYAILFLASFVVGMVFVHFSPVEHKTVMVFPSPTNINKIQYKDKADQCFDLSAKLVDCTKGAKDIPVQ
jgi:hypothetical protein